MQNIRILLAEDNETFRKVLKGILEQESFVVTAAPDGKTAREIFALEHFDLVLSDIRMPHLNGIELLHFVKKTQPVPVILMTGFSELAEAKDAYDMGASGFLAKPFNRDDLLALLRELLPSPATPVPQAAAPSPPRDDGYCGINIDEFVTGSKIPYSIYIQLADARFVKVAHVGQDLEISRIQSYKTKGITRLFLRRSDFLKYVGFNAGLVERVSAAAGISNSRKLAFMKHTGEILAQACFESSVDQVICNQASEVIEATIDILASHEDLFSLLESFNRQSDFLYAHSVCVSTCSVLIAQQLGWNAPYNRFRLALGGLFHDIGKREFDRELLLKPRRDLTPEEIRILETHPTRGTQILSQIPGIPEEVLRIVQEHHEFVSGTGYPKGLSRSSIHPLSKVVCVANLFCSLVVKNPWTLPVSPQSAIEKMSQAHGHEIDRAIFEALARALGVSSTKTGKK